MHFFGYKNENHALRVLGEKYLNKVKKSTPKYTSKRVCTRIGKPSGGATGSYSIDGIETFFYSDGSQDHGIELKTIVYEYDKKIFEWEI